jgi:hypothetical protein
MSRDTSGGELTELITTSTLSRAISDAANDRQIECMQGGAVAWEFTAECGSGLGDLAGGSRPSLSGGLCRRVRVQPPAVPAAGAARSFRGTGGLLRTVHPQVRLETTVIHRLIDSCCSLVVDHPPSMRHSPFERLVGYSQDSRIRTQAYYRYKFGPARVWMNRLIPHTWRLNCFYIKSEKKTEVSIQLRFSKRSEC